MTFLAVEKGSPAACGSGSRRPPTRSTPTTCGPSPPAGRPGIGPRSPWPVRTDAPRQALHAVYDALVAAADFFALRNQHKSGFDYPDAAAMYRAYESELFRFDQLYRHFCEAADLAEAAGLEHPQAAAGRHRGVLRQLVSDQPGPGLGQVRRAARRAAGEVADRQGAEPAGVLRPATSGPGWTRPTTAGPSSSSAMPSATRRPRNSPRNSTASTASRPR